MPLVRYDVASCVEGADGSVNFAMRDSDLNLIVPCHISGEALRKLCRGGESNGCLEDYESCKAAVHAIASKLYDCRPEHGSVLIEVNSLGA